MIAQLVKNPETLVRSLGREDPLEKGEAWRIPWAVCIVHGESETTEGLSLSLFLVINTQGEEGDGRGGRGGEREGRRRGWAEGGCSHQAIPMAALQACGEFCRRGDPHWSRRAGPRYPCTGQLWDRRYLEKEGT